MHIYLNSAPSTELVESAAPAVVEPVADPEPAAAVEPAVEPVVVMVALADCWALPPAGVRSQYGF